MMSGYASPPRKAKVEHRIYRVIVKADGWCIALGDACTLPFKDHDKALRIAQNLQRQADALSHQSARQAKQT